MLNVFLWNYKLYTDEYILKCINCNNFKVLAIVSGDGNSWFQNSSDEPETSSHYYMACSMPMRKQFRFVGYSGSSIIKF